MNFTNFMALLFVIIGLIFIHISKDDKKVYKEIYLYRMFAYLSFYTTIFILLYKLTNIDKILKSLETITTVSATIAGFVFAGISIIFALLNVERINALFKNDFLDNAFYKCYGIVALSLIDIAIYVLINQFNIVYMNNFILVYLYIFWMTLLLFMLLIIDFSNIIKNAKNEKFKK